MTTVYLVHGFNVTDQGEDTTGTLQQHFEHAGFRVRQLTYGWVFRLRARLCNPAIAKTLASTLEPDSIIVGHSNGCAIIYMAALAGARFRHATLINPALDSKLAIPDVGSVDVWYSPSDKWTGLAKYIPFSIWGSQGRTGYTGPAPYYRQFNEEKVFGKTIDHSGVFEHADYRRKIAYKTMEKAG